MEKEKLPQYHCCHNLTERLTNLLYQIKAAQEVIDEAVDHLLTLTSVGILRLIICLFSGRMSTEARDDAEGEQDGIFSIFGDADNCKSPCLITRRWTACISIP